MDYYQGVVTEYLRADRSMFVNTECVIGLEPPEALAKSSYWYCDVMAANFRERRIYLCEVTYSKTLAALLRRLAAWDSNWPGVCEAIRRDCRVPADWAIQPWSFIPQDRQAIYVKKLTSLSGLGADGHMPKPRVMFLEDVAPWKYHWNRVGIDSAADQ